MSEQQHQSSDHFVEQVDEPGGNGNATFDGDISAEIASLATLPILEYERARTAAAQRLGIRAPILDKLVQQARPRLDGEKGQGTVFTLEGIIPAADPVHGEQLLVVSA
jgi:hypothetical protein